MAAQYGMVLLSMNGGTMAKDVYFDDTAGNLVRWDNGSGASSTSTTEFVCPSPGYIVDVVLAAATGQTKTQILRNGQPTGDMLRNSIYLASVAFRPRLMIPFGAGQKIQMNQLA